MEMERDGDRVIVRLSRRNLLSLLTKLDHPESARTIYRDTDGGFLAVVAESDEAHYKDRQPGPMVGWTEREIAGK